MALIYSYQDSSTRYMSSLLNQCFYNPIHLLRRASSHEFEEVFLCHYHHCHYHYRYHHRCHCHHHHWHCYHYYYCNIIVTIRCHYHHYINSWKEIQSYKKSNKYWAVFIVIIVKINQSIHTYLQLPSFQRKTLYSLCKKSFFLVSITTTVSADPLKDHLIILTQQLLFWKM